jgi:hypothetical protein
MSGDDLRDDVLTDPSETGSMQLYHSDDSLPSHAPAQTDAPAQTEAWQQALALLQGGSMSQMPPEIQEATRLLLSQLPPPPPPVDASRQALVAPVTPAEPDAAAQPAAPPAHHPSIAGSSSSPAVASSSAPPTSATARKTRSYTTATDVWGMVGTPNFQPLELTWSEAWKADGPPHVMRKLKKFLTSLVRKSDYMPICHKDWRKVPRENKNRSFDTVQVFFFTLNFLSIFFMKLTSIDYFDRSASAFRTRRRSATSCRTWGTNGKNGSTPFGKNFSRKLWKIHFVVSMTVESPKNNSKPCTSTTVRRRRG